MTLSRFQWAAVLLFVATTGCAGGCAKPGGDDDDTSSACDAGQPSFVRNANLAVLGRRTYGQAEVNSYLLLASNAEAVAAGTGRTAILDSMMDTAEFRNRWAEHFMDELRVPRIDDQSMEPCYGTRVRNPVAATLAEHVRDNDAGSTGDGGGDFTLLDLLQSSLMADDVSPVYRANLFPLVAYTIPAANVPPLEAELARRQDSGNIFDSAYLNRDLVCLGCHNSETAVTYDPDPAINRHWPMPGLFERALYLQSTGIAPEQAHAMFRFEGFADFGGSSTPWGQSPNCGVFDPSVSPDPAGVDGRFGGITGDTITVYDLESSLMRGVDSLAVDGLQLAGDGSIADPDQAFAYLVAASIVEGVWKEVVGSPLTIANYFPRNEASRDILLSLTDSFVASHFSMRTLVRDVIASPYFNRLPPEAGCGTAYGLANVYDPWVTGDDDPARRTNSSADGVAPLSPRVLKRSAYEALEWTIPADWTFPQSATELAFDRGIGSFLKNSERGFKGLEFQARLVWEERFATCANPTASPDFVDRVSADAAAQGASVRDVVLALKDRLLNEASIDDASEGPVVESIFGVGLDTPVSGVSQLEIRTRRLCGIYLATPQFLMSGFSSTERAQVPSLNATVP